MKMFLFSIFYISGFFNISVQSDVNFLVNEFRGILRSAKDGDDWPCPLAADIRPCVCTPITDISGNYYALDMNCSDVVTSQDLWEIFNLASIPVKEFRQLIIKQDKTSSELTELTTGTFGDATFQYIEIENTALSFIEGGTFANSQNSLIYLTLSGSKLTDFPYESLSQFLAIEQLDLSNNNIVVMYPIKSDSLTVLNMNHNIGLGPKIAGSPGIFSSLPNIQNIYLSGIGIKYLSPGIFDQTLPKMKIIDVSNNDITDLLAGSFSCQNNSNGLLTHLWLDNNDIKSMQRDAITGMSTTCLLSLRNNKLIHLNEDVWDNVLASAFSVDYAGNPLVCGCDVQWIVFNDTLNSKVNPFTCYEGTPFQKLDPTAFTHHC